MLDGEIRETEMSKPSREEAIILPSKDFCSFGLEVRGHGNVIMGTHDCKDAVNVFPELGYVLRYVGVTGAAWSSKREATSPKVTGSVSVGRHV